MVTFEEFTAKYPLGKQIGRGSFALVHLATNNEIGSKVAVKIIEKKRHRSTRSGAVLGEVNCMLAASHPSIVKLEDHFNGSDKLYLVLELCSGGTLFRMMAGYCNGVPEGRARFIFRQILEGVSHLHHTGIVHRDLKMENIFIKESGSDVVKIGDFGFTRYLPLDRLNMTQCGSLPYVAPEVIRGDEYDLKCDCWSLGVLLYILLCGKEPFGVEILDVEELLEFISEHSRASYVS